MADNITLNTNATSGAVVKTDDDGTAHWQYVKVAYGADNTQTLVTAANGLTVQPDSGGFAVSATLDAETTKVIGTVNISAAQTIAAVTDITNTVTVDGTGTFAVQADLGANNDVQGMVAEGAAVTGTSPFLIAGDDGTNVKNIAVDASGNVQVDIVADASGTLATAANQTTIIGHVDGIEGLLTTIDADTGTLAGAVTGGQLQVDIAADSTAGLATSALQTTGNTNTTDIPNVIGTTGVAGPTKAFSVGGTEAGGTFRELAVDASGNLQVDIVADGAGLATAANQTTGNTSLGNIETAVQLIDNSIKADDAAFTLASDSVNMAGAVRDDTLSALTAIEGDAVPLRVNSTGALHVTGAGGGTQYTVDDPNPTTVTMAGVVRDDSLTTLTEADGDASVLRVSSTGALHVTGGGGGTEYTEDVATPNPIVGTSTVMERDDALSVLTPIEGDWAAMRCSAEGALWTQDFNSDAILADTNTLAGAVAAGQMQVDIVADGAGLATAANQSTGNTSLSNIETATQLIDDAIYADDADWTDSTSKHMLVGGLYQSVPQTVTDGDVAPLQVDSNGNVIEANSAAILADTASMDTNLGTLAGAVSGAQFQVDIAADSTAGLATSALQATVNTNTTDIPNVIGTDGAAGPTKALSIGGTDGSGNLQEISVDTDGQLQVDIATIAAGDNNIGNVDIVTLPASTNTIEVVGDVAHDIAAAGNPVLGAARATNSIEGLTQVAAADASYITSDLNGCLVTRAHTTLEENISERVSDTAGTSTNFTNFAAGGAGIHNYVTDVTITNTSATDTYVDLRDGSAGSVIWTFPCPANGGATHSFSVPLKGAANTALAYDVGAAASTVYISVNGFQAQG